MTEIVTVGAQRKEVWPTGQHLAFEENGTIAVTTFSDTADYHPALIARVNQLGADGSRAIRPMGVLSGTKVHHIEDFGCPEADLIDRRAAAMFARVGGSAGVVDTSWANIYRRGDYSMPHSHLRSVASIVYFLDLGDPDGDIPLNGRFSIVDPRLALCCAEEPHCLTQPFLPKLEAGAMIIFPSQVVHWVHPYFGTRPRLTLAWNFRRK
jgi:hypothetical protein